MTGPSPWSCIKVHYRVAGLSEEAWDVDGAVIEDFSLFRKKKCYHPGVNGCTDLNMAYGNFSCYNSVPHLYHNDFLSLT